MKTPIQGISISQSEEVIHVQSEAQISTLSSAIVGGGYSQTKDIINVYVDKDFHVDNPQRWLEDFGKNIDINENFIGLMTAVKLHKARIATLQADGFTVSTIITAGVGNATNAGMTTPFKFQIGTINIIILLDANLTSAAMLNAVITATEAKTALLHEKNIRTPENEIATGTSTDTVTIATTGNGTKQIYAGPITTIGWLIGRTVREALEGSLSAK